MNIRCEKCSTTYELDEKLLAPEGSPVQCTKCQHVFTAVPPRSAGRTLVGVPAAPPPQPPAPPRAPTASPGAPSGDAKGTGARQGPAIYRPSQSPSSSVVRTPRARRDTMGAFEARLKANARLRWLVPAAVVAIAAVSIVGWRLLSGGVDPAAQRRHAEAMALVALDDATSLERASQALDELARGRSGIASIEADRALAQLLLSTGLTEDVAPQAERLARKMAERDRAASAQPQPVPAPAPPEALKALTAEVEALRSQVEPRQAKARSLSEQAYAALKSLSAEREGDLSVARALAIHFASSGDREQALRFIRASGAGERDPWIRLADGWLDAREEGKEPRERAVSKLTALVAAQPEIVRARFLLAKTQAALGRREEAAATLDRLIAANPGHNRARRLREELVLPAIPGALQPVGTAPRLLAPPAPVPAAGTPPPGLPPGQAALAVPGTAPAGLRPATALPAAGSPAALKPAPVAAPGAAPVNPPAGAAVAPKPPAAAPAQPRPAAPLTAAPGAAAKPSAPPAAPVPGAKPAPPVAQPQAVQPGAPVPAPAAAPPATPAPARRPAPSPAPKVSDTDEP